MYLDHDCLFHYTSTPIAIEEILFHQRIKFSMLKNTGDPLEFFDLQHVYCGVQEEFKSSS